jgi:hypothetical protein
MAKEYGGLKSSEKRETIRRVQMGKRKNILCRVNLVTASATLNRLRCRLVCRPSPSRISSAGGKKGRPGQPAAAPLLGLVTACPCTDHNVVEDGRMNLVLSVGRTIVSDAISINFIPV